MAFFEVKKGKKWTMVKASGMKSINKFCKENGYSDWRMVGMMSRAEIERAHKECKFVGEQ